VCDQLSLRNTVFLLTAGKDYYDSAPKGFHIIGYDGAGTVLEVGPDCISVKPGDDVSYVGATTRQGSYAEYQLVSEFQCILKPKSLDFVQAASYGLTFGTAYQSLFDRLEIMPDENVGILIVCERAILAASLLLSIDLHYATADISSCELDQRWRRSRQCCDPTITQRPQPPSSDSNRISTRNNRLLQTYGRNAHHRPQERSRLASPSLEPGSPYQVRYPTRLFPIGLTTSH
jgi:hypothetical protein